MQDLKEYQATEFKRKVIDQVMDFARATKRDPITAFKVAITGNQIEHTRDGKIKINRDFKNEKAKERSERLRKIFAEKKGLNAEQLKGYDLDHVIPLQLGGMNNKSNLELITKEYHALVTELGAYLIKMTQDDTVSIHVAQKLMHEFRAGKITFDQIREIEGKKVKWKEIKKALQ